jgi:hypothetical protein
VLAYVAIVGQILEDGTPYPEDIHASLFPIQNFAVRAE